jgi:hypothetical protein
MNNQQFSEKETKRIYKILYRPVHTQKPVHISIYQWELKRLQDKEKQIRILLDELNEDREIIEHKIKQESEKENKEKCP